MLRNPVTQQVLPFWQFWSVGDDRVCYRCRPLHLFVARWDDPVWNEIVPLRHPGRRCSVVPILAEEVPEEASKPGLERLREVLASIDLERQLRKRDKKLG